MRAEEAEFRTKQMEIRLLEAEARFAQAEARDERWDMKERCAEPGITRLEAKLSKTIRSGEGWHSDFGL